MIETISSHFNYTEEYVLDHSLDWVFRKYSQAHREMWEQSTIRTQEGFKSLMLVFDSLMNKGKNFDAILPPTYEKAMELASDQKEQESEFVKGEWWLKGKSNSLTT
ncbi:hypothetical protein [Priestia megaterium]|uniref:hypothetical protein n=1 Tax=Priestia megaterium TaxID=1404 RepID=UPI0031FD3154